MRRRLVKLVVFLLLGAIVNVAVAWGCALLLSVEETPQQVRFVDSNQGTHVIGWQVRMGYAKINRVLFEDGRPYGSPALDTPLPWYVRTRSEDMSDDFSELLSGWPLVSFSCIHPGWARVRGPNFASGYLDTDASIRGGWSVFRPTAMPSPEEWRAVSLIPFWPGFAINTVFYAVILWVVFAVVFALRRRRRLRRGLCPACAYPVGESNVCTECGKPFIKQKTEKQKAEIT